MRGRSMEPWLMCRFCVFVFCVLEGYSSPKRIEARSHGVNTEHDSGNEFNPGRNQTGVGVQLITLGRVTAV